MKDSDLYLAIDLGTTSCKVALFTTAGNLKALARSELPVDHPRPDWMEADANIWWRETRRLIRQALAIGRAQPGRIAAVGLTGLMHSVVPIDANGDPVGRVMLWPDQRCLPQTRQLEERSDDRWETIAGSRIPWWTSAAKLVYLREREPEMVARADKFLLAKDFIRFKLTGHVGTDVTDSRGTHLFDPITGNWSRELIEDVLRLPVSKFPEILPSAQIVGGVCERAARETRLLSGTPVVCGAGDAHATLLGANMYKPRRLCLYLGTAAWIMCSLETSPTASGPGLSIHFIGATAAFGANVRWFRETFTPTSARKRSSYRWVDALAAQAPPGSEGAVFLPHMMGERGPTAQPALRGAFRGLTLAHRQPHLLRALLEGNAFQLRRILDGYDLPEIDDTVAVGGGAQSRVWREIIATVLNRTLFLPRVQEATALGAALLAAVGIGQFKNCKDGAAAWVKIDGTQVPDSRAAEACSQSYEKYCEYENA